jgi:hypothetical protein
MHFGSDVICAPRKGGEMIGLVDILEDYEAGYLGPQEQLELFAQFVRTGQAWTLGGLYARTARHLVTAGYITPTGQITKKGRCQGRCRVNSEEGREGSPCDVNPSIDSTSDEPIPGPFAAPNVPGPRRSDTTARA